MKYKIVFDHYAYKGFPTVNACAYQLAGYVSVDSTLIFPITYSPKVRYV